MAKRVVRKKEDNTAANVSIVTKFLLLLYLVVGLSPKVVELEYEGFQWYYFSVLNILSLLFIFWQRNYLKPFEIDKKAKQFFYIFLGLLGISIISVSQSLNVSESIVHLSRLVNVIAAIYAFYILLRRNTESHFAFIAKVCVILLAYYSLITMEHYIGNYTKPRNRILMRSFLHYFGNINFFTAALIIKIPFAIYLILRGNTIWKFVSYLVVLTSTLSLMFSGSRTAMLSFLIITLLMIIYLLLSIKINKKEKLFQLGYFILLPFISFFIFSHSNKIDKKTPNKVSDIRYVASANLDEYKELKAKKPELFKTEVNVELEKDRLTEILMITGRGYIWPVAIETFLDNPFLGVGYGNYKVHPKPKYFKKKQKSNGKYSISIRAHNDFLEKFVETGIIGGLLYISIFVFLLLLLIKLFREKESREVVLLISLSGIALTMDSFFNFPSERIPIYLFFVLMIALILGLNFKRQTEDYESVKESESKKIAYYLLVTFLLVTVGVNYMVYKAYIENTIFKNRKEFESRKYNLSAEGFKNRTYSFPDLDQDAIKMSYYLASYASLNKQWKESMDVLDVSIDREANTAQNYILKKLKAEIFLKAYKNLDSAEYYYKFNFDRFPAYKQNYTMLKNIYKGKKENDKLESIMHSYTKQNYIDAKEWVNKANYFYNKTKDVKLALKILDTGLAYNNKSLDIAKAKERFSKAKTVKNYYQEGETKTQYTEAIALYNKAKYKEALKIFYDLVKKNPKDHYAIQYVGITEMNLKNYKTAVKYLTQTIDMKIFKDGKAEYCRGFCYERLGKIELAKKDFRVSRSRKFPNAMSLAKSRYE